VIPLPSDEVHVWWSALKEWGLGPDDSRFGALPAEDLARSHRFRFARDRQDFLASHVLLRHVLSRYCGIAPTSLGFATGPHGKPYLAYPAGSGISFSLSRTSGAALCAVRRGAEVGADIEAATSTLPVDGISGLVLTPAEAARLARLDDPALTGAFLVLWTGKEAWTKATGLGLAFALDELDLSALLDRPSVALRRTDGPASGRWWVRHLDLAPHIAAAVAGRGIEARISVRTPALPRVESIRPLEGARLPFIRPLEGARLPFIRALEGARLPFIRALEGARLPFIRALEGARLPFIRALEGALGGRGHPC
jgi:4'-phosphopantetheinyl transferase